MWQFGTIRSGTVIGSKRNERYRLVGLSFHRDGGGQVAKVASERASAGTSAAVSNPRMTPHATNR